MKTELRDALGGLRIENIDEVIKILEEKGLIEEAWKNLNRLEAFLDGYGSIKRIPKPTPMGTKTVRIFVFG